VLRFHFNVILRAAVLCVCVLCAWAGTATANPVGLWYGEGQPHDPNILYLDQFNEDGTFRSEFRRYDRCEIVWQQVEEGRWNQDGDLIITLTDTVNGQSMLGYQEYRNEGQTENEIRLRHLETDYLFVERRIDSFEFPACWIGS
jgi:hypothetical protein